MSAPLSPELVPQAPEAPPPRDGAGAPSPAAAALAQVCRLLRPCSARTRKAALLRGPVLDVLQEAAGPVPGTSADADALLGPLHRLHHKHKGEQIRASALRRLELLDQPSPPGLRECLRQLLAPAEQVE